MSDQLQGNQSPSSEPGGTPGQETQPGTTPAGYVTVADFNQALADLKKELAKNYQGVQKQVDRGRNQIKAELDKYFTELKGLGVELTPQQKQQITVDKLLASFESPEAGRDAPAGQQAAQPAGENRTPLQVSIDEEVDRMIAKAGITLEDTDPELALIEKASSGTIAEYLGAVQSAIEAKKARLSTQGQRGIGEIAGRMPSLASGGQPQSNPIQNITDPDQLWELAKKHGRIK